MESAGLFTVFTQQNCCPMCHDMSFYISIFEFWGEIGKEFNSELSEKLNSIHFLSR